MSDPLIKYDPSEPGFFQNPYRQLEALREQETVHRTEHGVYLLLRYHETLAYLNQEGTSVMMESVAGADRSDPEALWQPAAESVINQDPPNHSRLRRLVMQAFTFKAINDLRPMIRNEYEKLISAFAATNGGDFVAEVAFSMPFNVICNMLGVEAEDAIATRDTSLDVTKAIVDLEHSRETLEQAKKAYAVMTDYFGRMIDAKRRNPDDKILSALIAAEEDGSRLSTSELVDMLALIYIGGFDSVLSMLGSGLMLALTHPDQLAKWRDNPSLDTNAIEEIIRFEPPVLFGGRRITTSDLEVDGTTIPAGSIVLACAGSANRDPRFWGDTGGQLILDRKEASRNLSFGGGIHRCLGTLLARSQGEIVLGSMIRQFPNMTLSSDEPVWKPGTHQRSLAALEVSLGL